MNVIIGLDEVGRGPLAGPVVAAAVALPIDFADPRIRDSKKLTAGNREQLCPIIKAASAGWAVVAVGHRRIERHNILGASLLAMKLALQRVHGLRLNADAVLVDGNQLFPLPLGWEGVRYEAVVGGDDSVVAISAASIIAKVWRDRLMKTLGEKYPGYGLECHSGYPTLQHRTAIASLGPCRIHRRGFRGVKEYLPSTLAATSAGRQDCASESSKAA